VPPLELTPRRTEELLARGEIEVVGRIAWSSNDARLVSVTRGSDALTAVYKPGRGEQPLWDFPSGSLFRREVAAYELARALGWRIVPETVLRGDGPLGPGMLQRFVEHDPRVHYFALVDDRPAELRRFAVFDVVANNADRKAGHCLLARADDRVYGIDHGLTFHADWKLRTVIWDFAGEPLDGAERAALERLCRALDGPLGTRLAALLDAREVAATRGRTAALLHAGSLPEPDPGYRSLPWPLV